MAHTFSFEKTPPTLGYYLKNPRNVPAAAIYNFLRKTNACFAFFQNVSFETVTSAKKANIST